MPLKLVVLPAFPKSKLVLNIFVVCTKKIKTLLNNQIQFGADGKLSIVEVMKRK